MTSARFNVLLVLILLLLGSCSNAGKDYEPILQLQLSADQSIESTSDDAAKLKFCDEVIDALEGFLKRHPDGEWNATAKTALESWQSKRAAIQETVNRKIDFEEILKLQVAAQHVMQYSTDYTVRMKSCYDMINVLQSYLAKNPKGQWKAAARTALLSWKSRKATLEMELGSLADRLYSMLMDKALQAANSAHTFSNIEDIHLEKRSNKAVGPFIQITDIYSVSMRGFFGSSIFKRKVTVSGRITPESKEVQVDDKVVIEEVEG